MKDFDQLQPEVDFIKSRLLKRQETIAVGESVTSGMLQLLFSLADEALFFYQGGITTYNLGQKSRHFHIDPIKGIASNCVSESIAAQMALGASQLFSSDWGIGITGYATRVPEAGNKLFAWFSIARQGEIKISRKISCSKKNPIEVQLYFAEQVLLALKKILD